MITHQIITKLEEGTVPWRRPWVNGTAVNWKTERPYRGINTILLMDGEYATFKQVKEAGGKVKKGEKGQIVVFWKWIEKKNADRETDEDDTKEKIPLLRYYKVFEINHQCEGLSSKRQDRSFEHDPVKEAEEVIKGYEDRPSITYDPGSAYYQPSPDRINVPPMKDFEDVNEYYSTLYHELIHSTGHPKRLNREGVTQPIQFGSDDYSKEELVAELGSAMLSGVTGIENTTLDNSASYIQSWLRALKNDQTLIVKASQQAQKASDRILGLSVRETN